jgi:O-antigen/teichoic acid export membrane protein
MFLQISPGRTQTDVSNASVNYARVWISALQVLALLNWSTDLFMIRILLGASAVSDYSILSKFFMMPSVLAALSSPVIQSAVVQGRLKAYLFRQLASYSWLLIISSSILLSSSSIFLFTSSRSAASIIGLSEPPQHLVLLAFSFLSLLSVFAGLYAPVANALGLFKPQVMIAMILLFGNILLSWFLAGPCGLGVAGVVGATALSMAVSSCSIVPVLILKQLRMQHT